MKVLKWKIDWHTMYNHLHNGGVEVEGDGSWDNVEILTHFGIALSGEEVLHQGDGQVTSIATG